MFGGIARRIALGVGIAAGLALAAPLAAQTYSDGYQLLQAVEKSDRKKFDDLIAKSPTVINSRDLTSGRTGLHIAVDRRDVVWLVYLINEGANPNVSDVRGVTPLMRASQLGWFEGLENLIKGGAKVDEPNSTGETPLILAVHRRDTTMMRALLKAGANPDRADNSGRSARDYAALDGRSSTTLAEIERNQPSGERRADAGVYGPSL